MQLFVAYNITNYDKIYLATKSNYYRLNTQAISELTENILCKKASIINEEIEILYSKEADFHETKIDTESNFLFDKCIECSIDSEMIVKILWQRIYSEQIAMRFICLRFAKNDINLSDFQKTFNNI